MGREVRMVPADWNHPTYDWNHPYVSDEGRSYLVGRHIALYRENYEDALAEWKEGKEQWKNGFQPSYSSKGDKYEPKSDYQTYSWKEYAGPKPKPEDYMPNWPVEERTHYMMYETTSEGTPISPAFATPEELAYWLSKTGASTFADYTATYDQWFKMIVGDAWAPSAVIEGGVMRGGVEALNS